MNNAVRSTRRVGEHTAAAHQGNSNYDSNDGYDGGSLSCDQALEEDLHPQTMAHPRQTKSFLLHLRALLTFLLKPIDIIKNYDLSNLQPDIIASLTVAVVTIPQAMAYALIAELPPQAGIYSAIIGAAVGSLWGSSAQLQTGPSNATSLLVLSVLIGVVTPGTPEYMVAAGVMAVIVGIIRLGMGFARLGVLVNFVSDSVIVGFTAGAGILIFINQIRHLLRLLIPSAPNLWTTIPNIIAHLPEAHVPSLLIGLGTVIIILILRRINRKLPGPLISVIIASAVVALLKLDTAGVRVVGELPRGLPPFVNLPLLDFELVGKVLTGSAAVAAIGLVEVISISRSIASQTGQHLDSNQEFVGQGLANIACGFFSGYTASGSFTRSFVNFEAGAKTGLSSVFGSIFVLLIMLILAPLAAYLPLASLAGAITLTAYGLIDQKEIERIWKSGNSDRAIMVTTGVATLALPLQYAVLTGIGISIITYLLRTSTPRVRVVLPSDDFRYFTPRPGKPSCTQLGVIEILGDLYFGAVSHIEERIQDNLLRNPSQRFLLLRMYSVENCDISGIHTLESIVRTYRERKGDVYFVHVQKPVLDLMKMSGFYEQVGADHYLDPDEAVSFLFHKILAPSICIYECPVRVFRYCQNLPKRLDLSCTQLDLEVPIGNVQSITPSALWDDLSTDTAPLVIDVREPREFKGGHIPNATSIPLSILLNDIDQIRPDIPTVLVCQGGRRSSRATAILQHHGHTNVKVLAGGMVAWRRAKLLEAVELRQ